jgi:hypothetical protein
MATLSYLQAKTTAVAQATAGSAAVGGDKVPSNERGMLVFRNGDASSKTVTMVVPGLNVDGEANPDKAYIVPAGGTAFIGPLVPRYGDPADSNLVAFTYSAVTACTVQAVLL